MTGRALLCALVGWAAQASADRLQDQLLADLTPTERWVAAQAADSGVVNLPLAPPELEANRHIRSAFLAALLTQAGELRVHRAGLYLIGAVLDGELELSYSDITPAVFLSQCRIAGGVNLTGARFSRVVGFDRVKFEGVVLLHRLSVSGDASFSNSHFADIVDLYGAEIGGRLRMNGVVFAGKQPPSLQAVTVGLGLTLSGARFAAGADLTQLKADGELVLDGVDFESPTEVLIASAASVGGDVFLRGARFAGPVDLTGLAVGGMLLVEETRFELADTPPQLAGIRVARQAFFSGVVAPAGLTMVGAHFSNVLADGEGSEASSWPQLNLAGIVVSEHLGLGSLEIAELFVTRAKVGGGMVLKDLRVTGRADLRDADIGALKLVSVVWPTEEDATWLEGLKWASVSAGEKPDDWQVLLAWIAGSRFDAGMYRQLEQQLRNRGQGEAADEVYIHGQRRANERRGVLGRWAITVFWDTLAGFGKKPERTVWIGLIIVLIGMLIFDPEMFDPTLLTGWAWFAQGRPWWRTLTLRFLLSLNQFLPGIDLGLSRLWQLSRVSFPTLLYYHFHKLSGWILIPVGLAAIYSQFR